MEILVYALKSAGVLTLFYLVYSLLLKSETHFQVHRFFLLAGILCAILLPFLQYSTTVLVEMPLIQNTPSAAPFRGHAEFPATPIAADRPWFSAVTVLGILYVLGVFVLLLRFLAQLIGLNLRLRKQPFQRVNGVKLIAATQADSPFSFFNYLVYNPDMHTEEQLNMVLKHELVHIGQLHSADVFLANLLVILQWFNPLAWQYKKCMAENLEFIADQRTVAQIDSKKDYQLALVKATAAHGFSALTNNFYKSFIKKRIIMINKSDSPRHNALKTLLILPLLAIFFWSFNVKEEVKYLQTPVEKSKVEKTSKKKPQAVVAQGNSTVIAEAHPSESEEAHTVKATSQKTEKAALSDKYRVTIDKNTTDAALEKIKEEVRSKYGISLNYSASRNTNNEIVSLSISFSGNGNNGNYQVTDDKGIDTFSFFIDDDGNPGFWSEAAEKRRMERMEQRKEIMKEREKAMMDRQKELEERMEEREIIIEERRKQMAERRKKMDRDREVIIEKGRQPGRNDTHILQIEKADRNNDPLYFVNGKEMSKSEIMDISADEIKSITVLKDEKAIKKYGGRGINGVVEITTKQ